jgi:heat shock protein HslJ
MTDETMDARLRAAGERWRADEATAAEATAAEATAAEATAAEATAAEATAADAEFDVLPRIARPHRTRRWAALASAAAIVAAAAVGISAVAAHHGAQPATGGDPKLRLTGHPWVLATNPGATVIFTRGTVRYSDGCDSGTRPVRITATTFSVGPSGSGSVCSRPSTAPRQNPSAPVDFGGLFVGTANWSIAGGRLIITKRGVGTFHFVAVDPTAVRDLDGVDWRVARMTDRAGRTVPVSDGPRIRFGAGTFSAGDGCNTLSGAAAVNAGRIVFGSVASTAIGCIDGARAIELFDRVVSGTVRFTIRGSTLSLTKPGVGRISFRPAAPQSARGIVGMSWRLTGTERTRSSGNSASGSGSSAVGSTVVRFDGKGGVRIAHRCYSDEGAAVIAARSVSISDVGRLASIPCPGRPASGRAEQREDEFVDQLLSGTLAWSVDGGTLTLTKDGDAATFARTTR